MTFPIPTEPVLTRERKTLVQQQSEVPIKEPAEHAARQVKELDKFAKGLMDKKKGCMDQIEADRRELDYINAKIGEESSKYEGLLGILRFRCGERDRIKKHLEMCRGKNLSLLQEAWSRNAKVRKEDTRMLKSMSRAELDAARGYGAGPGSTFSMNDLSRAKGRSKGASTVSAQPLSPLEGARKLGLGGGMSHSVSAPALRH